MSWRQLLVVFVPSVLILAAIAIASILTHEDMSVFTRDVASIADIHPLSGFLSSLGILLWCTAASVCLFAAMAARGFIPREKFRFLVSSSLFSAYLMLDDLFLFHEELARMYLGVKEDVIYVIIALAAAAYFIGFRRVILRSDYGILVLAVALLAASVASDVFLDPLLPHIGHWEYFIEDGAKWLGITSWCSYFVLTSYRFVTSGRPGVKPA